MDIIIPRKWLDALRSGNYEQGRETLTTAVPGGDYLYCCLGVYCVEVLNRNPADIKELPYISPEKTDMKLQNLLSGLNDGLNEVSYSSLREYWGKQGVSLPKWEDMIWDEPVRHVKKCSFNQIADFLEDNFTITNE